MFFYDIDGITFPLRERRDLSWLRGMGRVFAVFSQNDSGNISFGVENGTGRYFLKVAGLKTAEAACSPQQAVRALQAAVPAYTAIRHPNLIRLRRHFSHDGLYLAVFDWAEGECLFDHWNFDAYRADPRLVPPASRYRQLPPERRAASCDVLFSFLSAAAASGYVAVDFYDGSVLYDFSTHTTTVCDIDLFRKRPAVNDLGAEFPGSKRVKAPEEYRLGAVLDERTNVFAMGALLFHFFGRFSEAELRAMYGESRFFPCSPGNWELNEACYAAACRAVSPGRDERYPTVAAFWDAWRRALPPGLL